MNKLLSAWRLVAAMFILGTASAHAEAPEPGYSWDCWVAAERTTTISCIRDRGSPDLQPSDKLADENLEEILLDHIHYRIHSDDTSELGALIRDNVRVFQQGSIWQITIHTPPYDSSWEEGRPQMLVRALLCPGHLPCTINLKPPPAAAPLKKKRRLP